MNQAPTADEALVRIRGLKFYRGSRAIFDGVDIDIPRGSVTAIMGPSGTGKTTLLKLIGGQLRPDAGTIEVDGQDVHALSTSDLYRLRMRMGMLFQSGALLTDLSVFDNVDYFGRLFGQGRTERTKRIDELLAIRVIRRAGDRDPDAGAMHTDKSLYGWPVATLSDTK